MKVLLDATNWRGIGRRGMGTEEIENVQEVIPREV